MDICMRFKSIFNSRNKKLKVAINGMKIPLELVALRAALRKLFSTYGVMY
jgi:hypothetical protein